MSVMNVGRPFFWKSALTEHFRLHTGETLRMQRMWERLQQESYLAVHQ